METKQKIDWANSSIYERSAYANKPAVAPMAMTKAEQEKYESERTGLECNIEDDGAVCYKVDIF